MTPAPYPSLSSQLQTTKQSFLTSATKEIVSGITETSARFHESHTVNALKVGDHAPDFTLPNPTGKPVSLSSLLRQHTAVVLTWYRGSWCPYCNVQLRSFTQLNGEIEKLGAKLVALSPETADESMSTAEKNELKFEVLSDEGLSVALKYGIMFTVPDDIKSLYKQFGVDLDSRNGNGGKRMARLPLPATFVIGKDGAVKYVFADLDYTKRAEPSEFMDVLESLVQGC